MNFKIKNALLLISVALTAGVLSTPAFSAEPMLSTGGYATQMHKMAMMKMIDANGDHKVTKAEYDDYYSNLFDVLDTDKDNSVDATEWTGPSGKTKLSLATGGYSRELRTMKMMGKMDKDGDHKVTKEEFLAFHDAVFTSMDTSSTDEITTQQWGARALAGK